MKGHGKGSAFERDLCKMLSRWWTRGERDDVFWRTSNSGGRATVRRFTHQTTSGGYGDVMAVDPCGRKLLRLVTIEAKCVAKECRLTDLFHIDGKTKKSVWDSWIPQVRKEARLARTKGWLLVYRQSYQPIFVLMPAALFVYVMENLPKISRSASALLDTSYGTFGLLPLSLFLNLSPDCLTKVAEARIWRSN